MKDMTKFYFSACSNRDGNRQHFTIAHQYKKKTNKKKNKGAGGQVFKAFAVS